MGIKCLNCDTYGHTFKYCTNPIKSYGIIAFKKVKSEIQFLLIQRKDTIGYTDFLRGRYKTNNEIDMDKLQILIDEMTESERQDIITKDFDQLWANMWIEHKSGIFINEKEKARRIFNEIDKAHIINSSGVSKYLFQEYGFPKGRKNLNETPYNCAIREFKEETGILDDCYEILSNRTLTEEFIGTDRVRYSHTYFLAEIADIILPSVDNSQEIRSVDFFTYKQSYRLFRNYDIQKKYILSKAYNLCKF